jgi:hypothetical protein
MVRLIILVTLFCGIDVAIADTVHVTVGDTGCAGRQIGVTESWQKIPGVVSVSVVPRNSKDPTAQRVFAIVSQAASPTQECLRKALGRRAKSYPIVAYQPLKEPRMHPRN